MLHLLQGFPVSITSLAFSPDSQRLLTSGSDAGLRLWDVQAGTLLATWTEHTGVIPAIAWSQDGQWIASGGSDKTSKIFDAQTGKVRQMFAHQAVVERVALHPNGKMLYTSTKDGDLRVWDIVTGLERGGFRARPAQVRSLAVSGDGQWLALAEGDRAARVVHADTGLPYSVFRGKTETITAVALSQDGRRLASACQAGSIQVWDVTSPQEFTVLHRAGKQVHTVALHPDGRRLLVGLRFAQTELLDMNQRKVLMRYKTTDGHPGELALSPDGSKVALLGNNTIRVADTDTDADATVLRPGFGGVCVAWHPGGKWLLVGGRRGTGEPLSKVLVCNAATGAVVRSLPVAETPPRGVKFTPDGAHLAVLVVPGTVQLWTGDGTRLLFTLGTPIKLTEINEGFNVQAAFSRDGSLLAVVTAEGISLYRVTDGRSVKVLPLAGAKVGSLAFHPDGTRLAAATYVGTEVHELRVWDTTTGHELLRARQPLAKITNLAFSSDGQRLIGASGAAVLCWDGAPLAIKGGFAGQHEPTKK
jgi:WD40 repeat protein